MPSLDQIAETGIFLVAEDSFQKQIVPFDERLTAEYFAEEINSGRLSVRDAYRNYWSYEEDAELWDLPKDREWRALLPSWRNVLQYMINSLRAKKAIQLIATLGTSAVSS